MAKAVLVIDMPNNCGECPIVHSDFCGEAWCNLVDDDVWYETKGNKRYDYCPLKPLPRLHTEIDAFQEGDDYTEGWNECLDEILGES